jgi:hypothetical protein
MWVQNRTTTLNFSIKDILELAKEEVDLKWVGRVKKLRNKIDRNHMTQLCPTSMQRKFISNSSFFHYSNLIKFEDSLGGHISESMR